jgi:hypothetical protein
MISLARRAELLWFSSQEEHNAFDLYGGNRRHGYRNFGGANATGVCPELRISLGSAQCDLQGRRLLF